MCVRERERERRKEKRGGGGGLEIGQHGGNSDIPKLLLLDYNSCFEREENLVSRSSMVLLKCMFIYLDLAALLRFSYLE